MMRLNEVLALWALDLLFLEASRLAPVWRATCPDVGGGRVSLDRFVDRLGMDLTGLRQGLLPDSTMPGRRWRQLPLLHAWQLWLPVPSSSSVPPRRAYRRPQPGS